MKKLLFFSIALLISIAINPNVLSQQLIAHYPLRSNANDSTGNNAGMTLINTPFQDDGIYCNGIYNNGVNDDYCHAATPHLRNFNFKAFTISVQFKVTDPLNDPYPVFVGGQIFRWIGFYLAPDSTVMLKYNNSNYQSSTVRFAWNTWHLAKITYKDSVANLYLDDTLAVTLKFGLIHGIDSDITISDLAVGRVFKGLFRDLKVYNLAATTTNINTASNSAPGDFTLFQNYPNPFNSETTIIFQLDHHEKIKLQIFRIDGQLVRTLVDGMKQVGLHQSSWDGKDDSGRPVASGIYLLRLSSHSFQQIRRMAFLK